MFSSILSPLMLTPLACKFAVSNVHPVLTTVQKSGTTRKVSNTHFSALLLYIAKVIAS